MVGGAPVHAREPFGVGDCPMNVLDVSGAAGDEGGPLRATWHCVQLSWRSWLIAGARRPATTPPDAWQARHSKVLLPSIACGMVGGAPSYARL